MRSRRKCVNALFRATSIPTIFEEAYLIANSKVLMPFSGLPLFPLCDEWKAVKAEAGVNALFRATSIPT